MSSVPLQGDPRNRVISITVAVISLVLGVLPLTVLVVGVVRRSLHHQPGMPPVIVLVFQVVAVGLIGLSVTILRNLRRGEVFPWVGGPSNYSMVLLPIILGAMMTGYASAIQDILVGRGVRPGVAYLLALLPIIAGGLVFAVYWRRASAARVQQ